MLSSLRAGAMDVRKGEAIRTRFSFLVMMVIVVCFQTKPYEKYNLHNRPPADLVLQLN